MIRRKIGLSIMIGVWTFVPYGYAMDENKENNRNEAAAQESAFDVMIQDIADKNEKQRKKLTPVEKEYIDKELLEAAERKDIIDVQKALEAGADVNTYKKMFIGGNITPLYLACGHNNYVMVNMLLKARADVNGKCGFPKETALLKICSHSTIVADRSKNYENNLSIMRSLIAAKANVNANDGLSGTIALMHVVVGAIFNKSDVERFNILEKVCLLIGAEADVNKVDNSGETVLTRLVQYNSDNDLLIKAIIYAGADIRATHHFRSKSALDMAKTYDGKPLQKLMIEAEKTRIQAQAHALSEIAIILRHISYVPLALLVFDYTMIPYDTFDEQQVLSAFIKAEQKNKSMKDFEEFYNVTHVKNKRFKCVVS